MHELPLVFFTLLAQASVGITLFAYLGLQLNRVTVNQYKIALFFALIAIGCGGIASLFHLGQPLRAINALMGIGRSPMSNEVATTIGYGVLVLLTAVFAQQNKPIAKVKLFGALAALCGMVLLAVIPSIYTLVTVPQWNTIYTTLQMVLTAMAIGAIMLYAITRDALFSYVGALFLIVGVVMLPGYFSYISSIDGGLLEATMTLWTYKAIFAGIALLGITLSQIKTSVLAPLAVVSVFVSEFCGRAGFFDLWQIGM